MSTEEYTTIGLGRDIHQWLIDGLDCLYNVDNRGKYPLDELEAAKKLIKAAVLVTLLMPK